MKNINTYINEKLHITTKSHIYSCHPKDKFELRKIIIERIKSMGNECDLNDIDVSNISDMSDLFNAYNNTIFKKFNGNISQWDVSNTKHMGWMFYECENFNCDLSQWDVSNVKNMNWMFYKCEKFKQNLNEWDVSNVKHMKNTFYNCPTKPEWYKE